MPKKHDINHRTKQERTNAKKCTRKKLKTGVILALLFVIGSLCACNQVKERIVVSYHQIDTIAAEKKPMWESCTVSVKNHLIGTEFYVLSSNGEYGIYETEAICSLSTFIHNKQIIQDLYEITSGSFSDEELTRLNQLIPQLKSNGAMLPIKPPDYNSMYRIESIEVSVSVDGLEEMNFLKNYDTWAGYPPKEYDELIQFIRNIYPNSAVLVR